MTAITNEPLLSTAATVSSGFEHYEGRRGLRALHEDWRRVLDTMAAPRMLHAYEWYQSLVESYERNDAGMHFFCLRRDGRPAAIFPLQQRERRLAGLRLRSLEIPQNPHLSLADFIFAPEPENGLVLCELVGHLRRTGLRWDVLVCPQILEDSAAWYALQHWRPRLLIAGVDIRCEYIECRPPEQVLASVSKNFKGNLRKACNKLMRMEGVEYVVVREPHEIAEALDEFLEVEASGWKGAAGTAIKLDDHLRRFYGDLAENYARAGRCEVWRLRAGGRCLAGKLCVLWGDTSYVLKMGYDEAYAAVAPGNALLLHMLEYYSKNTGVRYLNLMNDTPWHANWKPDSYNVLDAYLFNRSPRGLAACGLIRAKRVLRQAHARHVDPLLQRLRARRSATTLAAAAPAAPAQTTQGDDHD